MKEWLLFFAGLIIFAVIFIYPKFLVDNPHTSFHIAKEASYMIGGAFEEVNENNGVSASTKPLDFLAHINSLKLLTSVQIDGFSCSKQCAVELHNGSVIAVGERYSFGSTASTSAIFFVVDPDGQVNGKRPVFLWMYPDGVIRSSNELRPNTYYYDGSSSLSANAFSDPDWYTE